MVKLTDEQRAELEALRAMPDDQIDYSDIPEMTEAEWSKAKRGIFYKPDWQDITLRLDQNIIDWFEEQADIPEKGHNEHQPGSGGPYPAGKILRQDRHHEGQNARRNHPRRHRRGYGYHRGVGGYWTPQMARRPNTLCRH